MILGASGPVHKEQTVSVLLAHLEKGWRAGHIDVLRYLTNHWQKKVAVSVEILEVRDNVMHFIADMGNIRLNGTDEAHCLVFAGADANTASSLAELWEKTNGPSRLIFVFALSRESYQLALHQIPKERAVILAPDSLSVILEGPSPLEDLKRRIREQIPLRRLIPFNIKNAVSGHMFSGRSRLLTRLREEDDVSFAIAGPSRIGKSSLLSHHHRLLKLTRDPRMHSTFRIDCFSCQDRTPDGVARFIALKIDSSSASSNMTSNRLPNFFRFWRSHFNRPIELLLDEVDEIFHPNILQSLGQAAKDRLCRLVFAGKGVLLRAMLDRESPLSCRLDLLRLEPLRPEEATKLLIEPLQDLGIELPEQQEMLAEIHKMSGDFPHLIQYFGSKLVDVLLTEGSRSLDLQHFRQVRDSIEATSYFMSPFRELKDPKTRVVAFAMLCGKGERMQVPGIRDLAREMGAILDLQQTWDICLDLTINNILALDNGAFRVANQGLSYYVRQTGFLAEALREAKSALTNAKEK